MGHPHLQRLKTKLLENNEKLEERDRCIATLRAQCAYVTEQLTSVEARNGLLETIVNVTK